MLEIIYYAHSMVIYNTEQEQKELDLLYSFFHNGLIYNPNRYYIQYHPEPMKACLNTINDEKITGLAYSMLEKKYLSCGVYSEIKFAQKLNLPLYQIETDQIVQAEDDLNIVLIKNDRLRKWAEVRK